MTTQFYLTEAQLVIMEAARRFAAAGEMGFGAIDVSERFSRDLPMIIARELLQ